MKKSLCIFLCGLSMACSHKHESEDKVASKDALKDEVMQLHNDAMIPWGEIHSLYKQLETKINESDTTQVATEVTQRYQRISQSLEEADAAMMEWMRAFHPEELQDITADSAITILQQKKASMEKVSNQVHLSVDSAKALLEAK